MSERHKPHLGRTRNGDLERPVQSLEYDGNDPQGTARVADSVDVEGTRVDVGTNATRHADQVQKAIDDNRACVEKFRRPDAVGGGEG